MVCKFDSEKRVHFSRFYLLDEKDTRGALRVEAIPDLDFMQVVSAAVRLPAPIAFRHHIGGRPRDLLATSYAGQYLFSSRLIRLLEERRFTGWTTYPVKVYGKGKELIEGYEGFAVTGRCGEVDWSRGEHVLRLPPVPGGRGYSAWIGMNFDPASWDGRDIFLPQKSLYTIVVEKAKAAIERAKITNVKFTCLTEFERTWPLGPFNDFSVGR